MNLKNTFPAGAGSCALGLLMMYGAAVAVGAGDTSDTGTAGTSPADAPVTTSPAEALAFRAQSIPDDFPQFRVGDDVTTPMMALRDMYWLHSHRLRPMATLWDEWLLPPMMWPEPLADRAAEQWRNTLSARVMDPDGYVATHQHHSIAHQRGWPFPYWEQGAGFGWHFSFHDTVGQGWRPGWVADPAQWYLEGAEAGDIEEEGLVIKLTEPGAVLTAPPVEHDAYQAPFVQVRWRTDAMSTTSTPYIEWTRETGPTFSEERRMYFDPPAPGKMDYTMVPLYRHPQWEGTITGIRIGVDNPVAGTTVTLQAFFSQYDTRHNVNNPSYVSGCIDYFLWTGDLNFLRENIERIRLAMRFMETEFGTDKNGIVTTPWIGHEGTAGVTRNEDGSVKMLHGRGVGNNYWDLVPFGQQDAYATIRHYGAARMMAQLEGAIADNPGWNIATSPLMRSEDHWRSQAEAAKLNGNRLFWNEETGRFTVGIDSEGNQADYGFTFLNLEAIYYSFATDDHAKSIMDWLDGRRTVADDTSQTTDIYRWRFAPRATTKRNVDHYGWFWSGADTIPFGNQVQDGGAVLGFSYHDIMARLTMSGPDDAARRLEEIMNWYGEVVAEGGYRAYYDGKKREGNLQGGNVPGGLGMDQEFFESVLVPHVMLEGFLGFEPLADGFSVQPQLPSSWPVLEMDNIYFRGFTLNIVSTKDRVTITPTGGTANTTHKVYAKVPNGFEFVKNGTSTAETIRKTGMAFVEIIADNAIQFKRMPGK